MGDLRNKRIVQSRNWLDPNQTPIPSFDYDFVYPISVYAAIKKNMDDNSSNLEDELINIYRLISEKQDIVEPGVPGNLMTWSGVRGQIGSIEVTKSINIDPALRSHQKIPTERAIGDTFDTKASIASLNVHINDNAIHITDIERVRWNSMAPLSSLQAHISNATMHITNEERTRWNGKANQSDVDDHIYNSNNPHNVTAHQVGTYTRREIDDMFASLRETFFNYMNIQWDDRTNTAELVNYHPANWNPNYVLQFNDALPDVSDNTLTYFAIKPTTDYLVNESNDVIIYIKRPGLMWQEVGFSTLKAGDLVIQFPDTAMHVWVQGRFMRIFADDGSTGIPGISNEVWYPNLVDGTLSWVKSNSAIAPTPVYIKGEDGYVPIKGIDYDDGKDGQGVSPGGERGDLLTKLSDENFDTTWRGIREILEDLVLAGEGLPEGVVKWGSISGRPEWYNELGPNDDGFITQGEVTRQLGTLYDKIAEIQQLIEGVDGIGYIRDALHDHLEDYNNPHRISPAIIGAVTLATFTGHVQNFNNPHNVSKEQIGLGNADNTSDINKPISNATQEALDRLQDLINGMLNDTDGMNYITNARWDNTLGALVFTYRDLTTFNVSIPLSDVFNSIYFDENTKELVIILPDGSEHRININALIQTYHGSVGTHINVIVENDNVIKADIIPSSIGEYQIMPSVHLRSSPTTTTQPVSDKSTRIATTEFVRGQVINNLISYEVDRPLSANMGRILNERKADIDEVINIIQDLKGIDVIDHLESTNALAALSANMGRYLDLTKAPRVHTSPAGATFGRATISLFGHARASDVDPLMDGTVFRGTDDGYFARSDHRHPTDTTRAPIHFPDPGHNQYAFTGEPRSTHPPADDYSDWIVTTKWVRENVTGVLKGTSSTEGDINVKDVTLKSSYMQNPIFVIQIGIAVAVTFDYKDVSGYSIPTKLNVQDSGEIPILFGGDYLKNGMLGKEHTHLFVYDGVYWRLINPVPGTGRGDEVIGPGGADDDDTIINRMSGHNGYTIQANGPINEHGEVSRIWFSINFTNRVTDVEFTISNTSGAFAARMGDNSLITLRNPTVIDTTRHSATVQFEMDEPYPSNSPCNLVYHTGAAWFNIKEI